MDDKEGEEVPLSPQESHPDIIHKQPCAIFLLESEPNVYYEGQINKKKDPTSFFRTEQFTKFVSYKFTHTIDDSQRTFCVTFRKERSFGKGLDILGGPNNVYFVRLSLIEEATQVNREEKAIKCKGKESLILNVSPFPFSKKIITPTQQKASFSSITSGDKGQIAEVKDMTKMKDGAEQTKFKTFFENNIENQMDYLGKILVDNCDGVDSTQTPAEGGYTRKHNSLSRRRKSVFKRKGKKSYKKKKYGKSKKCRRFRRSVRSRR